jgi:hypothetical protein
LKLNELSAVLTLEIAARTSGPTKPYQFDKARRSAGMTDNAGVRPLQVIAPQASAISKEEARRIAVNIAKLPELAR